MNQPPPVRLLLDEMFLAHHRDTPAPLTEDWLLHPDG
jgi:hypothetical protein